MSIIVHIKVFNEILDQFFEFLETEFDEFKSDIVLTRTGIDFIRQNNPRLVIEQFMTMIEPYKTKVFECDEDFFLNFKYSACNIISARWLHKRAMLPIHPATTRKEACPERSHKLRDDQIK